MPDVHFVKQNVTLQCPVGTNLRLLARDNGVQIYAFPANLVHCRGFGLCGTCRVKVDNPRALSTPTAAEERKVIWEGPQFRLACQTQVLADVSVITNPRKEYGWMNHPTYQWMKDREY